MLDVVMSTARRKAAVAGFDVEILSLATANPPFVLIQAEAAERAKEIFPHLKRLWPLYDNTGIELRYNCEPIDWYLKPHSWEERTASFHKHALDLLEEVTRKATEAAGIGLEAIDMIVTNTVTGLAIPSLDAMLFNRLKFAPTVERLPIFGLGCGGGVAGLARAARMAQAADGAHVLFLTVDLCSLCLRVNDPSPAMFVSSALFGDGAAGVVLHNTADGSRDNSRDTWDGSRAAPRILAMGEWCCPETEHIMGWDIKDDGFGIVLSSELPALMSTALAPALQDFLDRNGFRLARFQRLPVSSGRPQIARDDRTDAGTVARATRTFMGGAAPLRQHVLGDRPVRARSRAQGRRAGTASAGGVRPRLLRLFCCGRPMMNFGWGAVLLAYTHRSARGRTVVGERERAALIRGRRHRIRQIRIFRLSSCCMPHGWSACGCWPTTIPFACFTSRCSSSCRSVRFWVLVTLGRRWTIRIIGVPGETLIARGPYRYLHHPNYAVVTGEIAVVPLALGLPIYALVFSILNAIVLAIRIPAENAALAYAAATGPL